MSKEPRHLYEFGPYFLDTGERLLRRDGVAVALTPKAFETLVVLIRQRGRLVEKDDLMKALWPESHVEESNLTNNVWTLRKTLGKAPDGQPYIETVPKRGYRFVASVTELPDVAPMVAEQQHAFTHSMTDEAVESVEAQALPKASANSSPSSVAAVSASSFPSVRFLRVFTPLKIGVITAALLLPLLTISFYRATGSRGLKRDETAVAPGRSALHTIAVLPFKTIGTGHDENEYLGVGMSDALITGLGNSRDVVVRPTSAVRRYTDPLQDPLAAGREQGVEAVLDGSIQRAGDRIRVTVQLFRAQDGATLWTAKFDERFTDIFAVQDSISQQVLRELMVELNPEERHRLQQRGSENIEAYQAYLKGLLFWNKRTRDGYQKAIAYFSQAIEQDPSYAQAYIGLGNAYAFMGGHDQASQSEALAKQRAAVQKALEIDGTLAEAHAAMGLINLNSDWHKAEAEFKRALDLNPNYATTHQWYGEFLAWTGRFDEAITHSKRAHDLDPLSLIISTDLAKVYLLARRYDEAIAHHKSVLELDPEFEVAHGLLALTYSKKGQHTEALRELREIKDLETDPMYLSFLGYVYGEAGMKKESQQALRRLRGLAKQTYVSPQWMAIAYTGIGDKNEAFKWLDRSFAEGAQGMITVKVSPVWDGLRSDPRFAEIQQRAGF